MKLFTPYRPQPLPPLAPSRIPLLDRVLRILESEPKQHVTIQGHTGSGRSTVAHHLLALTPKLRRPHRFMLETNELLTALLETPDPTNIHSFVESFAARHQRSVILIPNATLLTEGLQPVDIRRVTHVLTLLLERDIRCVIISDERSMRDVLAQSRSLLDIVYPINLKEHTSFEVSEIISAHGGGVYTSELIALARRFMPQRALPASAIDIWNGAQLIAKQKQEQVTIHDIHQFLSEVRDIPLDAISSTEYERIRQLPALLDNELIGQPHVIKTVSSVLTRAYAGFRNPTKPIASFLFLGPSGVGKTQLAKILSRALYQSNQAFHRIDMSEFSESHTVQRLVGAPPGYVGYEEGGQLTNPVERDPYSLVLLDEIEKAHPKVFDIFLQLLDDGRLTDGRGMTVDFSQTIVIATSNIGLHEIVEAYKQGVLQDHEAFLTQSLLPRLVEHFRPEFLNRFDAIIVFQPLGSRALLAIGSREIERLSKQLSERSISLSVRAETLEQLAQRSYQPTFGARPMIRAIQDRIEAVIAEQLVSGKLKPGGTIQL